MVVLRDWGKEEMGNWCLTGTERWFYKVKSAVEMGGCDSYKTMWMYSMTLHYIHLKIVKMASFALCVFYNLKIL